MYINNQQEASTNSSIATAVTTNKVTVAVATKIPPNTMPTAATSYNLTTANITATKNYKTKVNFKYYTLAQAANIQEMNDDEIIELANIRTIDSGILTAIADRKPLLLLLLELKKINFN